MEFLLTNAAADRDWATWVTNHLDAAGYASRQAPPALHGQDPLAIIETAQAAGQSIIVLISYDYLEAIEQSGAPTTGRCTGPGKTVLVRIEDIAIPDTLAQCQVVDVFDVAGDYDATTERLFDALGPPVPDDPAPEAPGAAEPPPFSLGTIPPPEPAWDPVPSIDQPSPERADPDPGRSSRFDSPPPLDTPASSADAMGAAGERLAGLDRSGSGPLLGNGLPLLPSIDVLNPQPLDGLPPAPGSWSIPSPVDLPPPPAPIIDPPEALAPDPLPAIVSPEPDLDPSPEPDIDLRATPASLAPTPPDNEPAQPRRARAIPFSDTVLWGREDTLDLLSRHADTRVPGTLARIAVLVGEPGTGRSHLAAAHAHRVASNLDIVGWIHAGNDVTVRQEFVDFASQLGLDPSHGDVMSEVRSYLETTAESWLLVIDEAQDWKDIDSALPRQGNGQVVVTSEPELSWEDTSRFVIEPFDVDEAVRHLTEHTQTDRQTAEAVVARLGGLPIALRITAAITEHRGTDLAEVLDRLDLAERGTEPNEQSAFDSVISAAVDEVRAVSVLAAATLQSLAYTADAPIPSALLAGFDDLGQATMPEGGTTRLLQRLGLTDADPSSSSIHSLVRAGLRRGREDSGEHAPVELLFDHLDLAFERFGAQQPSTTEGDSSDTTLAARLFPHAIEAAHYGMKFDVRTESAASITARSAHYLLATGAPSSQTIPLCERAALLTDEKLGPDHPTTVAARRNLADALVEGGEHARALDVQATILSDCERTLGQDHPSTAVARANLAANYATYGDHQRALDLATRAREDLTRLGGETHPDTLRVRLTKARALAATGDVAGADVELASLNEDMTTTLGADDPTTIAARAEYATNVLRLGDSDRAVEIQDHVVHDSERVHGAHHPDTVEQQRKLAEMRADAGDQSGSITIHEQILAEAEKTHGRDHIETIIARNDLASTYADVGELDQAIEIQTEVLGDCERTLGQRHPDTLTARNNLATSYGEAGRLDEAVQLQEQVLADHEQELGDDHAFTVAARSNLALALTSQGDHTRASVLHARLAEDHERSKGPDHPHTLTALHNLANSTADLGDQDGALELRKRVLSIRERVLGFEHPQTLAARNNLANSYAELGEHDAAYELRRRVLDDREKILGPDHPQTLGARNNLANSCADRGDHDTALALRKQVLGDRERVLGPDHPNTITARNNLANSCAATGNHGDALALRQRTLADCERVLGVDHPHSQTARANLISSYETLGAMGAAEALRSGQPDRGIDIDAEAERQNAKAPPLTAEDPTDELAEQTDAVPPVPAPPVNANGSDHPEPTDESLSVPVCGQSAPAASVHNDSPRRGRRLWPRR